MREYRLDRNVSAPGKARIETVKKSKAAGISLCDRGDAGISHLSQ
jgi:hypothetical protein